MKNVLYVIIAIIILSILSFSIYVYKNINEIISKIKFRFELKNIDFSKLSFSNQNIDVQIKTTIGNENFFPIIFSNLYVRLFYNNEQIATSKQKNTSIQLLPANNEMNFVDTLIVNASLLKAIPFTDKQIDYEIDVDIFGFKIKTIKNSYII